MITWEEARNRMSRRGTNSVRWQLAGKTIEYRYIPATSARNHDGTPVGEGQDPDRVILQQMVWREGSAPQFSNSW